MLSIAICDDQPHELAILQSLLEQYRDEKAVDVSITAYPSGESLLVDIQQNGASYSLLLLDVLMAGLTGIETAACLREGGCQAPLAFLTTTRDYAVESYEVKAADYLLKPVSRARLWALLDGLQDAPSRPCLPLHIRGNIRYCFYSDILFFESLDHCIYLHQKDGETLRCAETLAAIAAALAEDPRFYRCHKSYLINFDYVDCVEDTFILAGGIHVPYRIREKKKIANDYYRYLLKKSLTQGS
ncbi:MAG: LytTR family DNA-binding domain-containing protein [Gemmiger sp.]|nr:LytTR family DNA-binding domain-containing protein [Gemmiger sp.]